MGFGDTSKKDKQKAAASAAGEAAAKAAEDAAWNDNDKGNKSKASRAADKEAKADAKLQDKLERKAQEAAEEEANSKMKGANKQGGGSAKVTQAEIARRQALLAAMGGGAKSKAAPKKKTLKTEAVDAAPIEANTNRERDVVEASGIDAALGALEVGEKKEKKMNYKEYEAMVLPGIQEENPGLKMSQAKERAFKMWERAPENPKNQEK
eukprot:TRINITY_DN31059_c0_g1_i1.p2 TRINITY_DN31059_c0_g1~~TRINITY_DN31059_c0_g1_i1.p2  ORF type:complete len:209 (+),score=87.71 TRINITY_DN31059_c0_g1_i1:75-701(+)